MNGPFLPASAQRTRLYIVAMLAVVSVGVYWNGLHGAFVYDDRPIIVDNPLIRTLPRALLVFTTAYWGTDLHGPRAQTGGLYRPVTSFSYAVNYSLSGLHPELYHLTNILLHAVAVGLVFLLALRFGWSPGGAGVAALAFAVIPVHTEAVTSLVGRAEVLATVFLLSAWLLLFQTERPQELLLGSAFFVLAGLSKENGMTLLPALILSELVLSKNFYETVQKRYRVWSVLTVVLAGLLLLRRLVSGHALLAGSTAYFTSPSEMTVALTMAKFTVFHYLWPLVSGLGLCADYSRPALADARWGDSVAWVSLALLMAMIAGSLWAALRKRSPGGFAATLFFLFLFPVSNLFFRLDVIGAERFLYLPSIGFCLLLGSLAAGLWSALPKTRPLLAAGLVAMGLTWSRQTLRRNRVWLTPNRFWTVTLADSPRSPRAWNGFGTEQMHLEHYAAAQQAFEKALALDPALLDARYNEAELAFFQGRLKDAEMQFLDVLHRLPWEKDSLLYLAVIADQQRDWSKAAWYYADVLKIDPYNPTAHRNLGLLLCRQRKVDACVQHLNSYLRAAPAGEETSDVRTFLGQFPSAPPTN